MVASSGFESGIGVIGWQATTFAMLQVLCLLRLQLKDTGDRLVHSIQLLQYLFHFLQFNASTQNLDLLVDSSEELDLAVAI